MEIKGVKIGDKFLTVNKTKRDATVIDIYTITNSKGDIVDYKCIASYKICNQDVIFETPFSTVKINLIN